MKLKKVNLYLLTAGFLASESLFAHGHGPHEHGTAHLNIAPGETNELGFIFDVPTESIYGFEHAAKSKKDKAAEADGIKKLKDFGKLVILDPVWGCEFKNVKFDVVKEAEDADDDDHDKDEHHGEHREVHAEWKATCKKSPVGSEIQFKFGDAFSRMKKLAIVYTSDAKQISQTLDKGNGKINI